MFETVEQTTRLGAGKRLLALSISVAVHLVALSVLVVVPLILFNLLPQMYLLTTLAAPPQPPAPLPPSGAVHERPVKSQRVHAVWTGDIAPDKTPQNISPTADAAPFTGVLNPFGNITGGLGAVIPGANDGMGIRHAIGQVELPPPPPPRPRKKEPMHVGGNVQESRLLKRVDPVYPELARRARVSGIVILQVTVDEEGNVSEVRVLRGHPLLDDSAVRAVQQWKYTPTRLNGEPVPVIAMVTVIFNLK